MNRTNDLAGYPFTAADLREVCAEYAAELVSAMETTVLDFEIPESYREPIYAYAERSVHKTKRHAIYRRIAVALAVFVILFNTMMVTNVHARETVVQWLRQVFPDHILYQFFGDPADEPFYHTIGWIPEGFALTDFESNEKSDTYIYEHDEEMIIVAFSRMNAYENVEFSGYNEYERIDATINGWQTFIYQDAASKKVNLTMFDQENEILIEIDTNIGIELTKIVAESIH